MPYELKHNRTLPFVSSGQLYTLSIKPISRESWLRYFDSTAVEEQYIDGQLVRTSDNAAARLQLLGEVLVDAAGYGTSEGKPIAEVEGWRDMIPVGHRSAMADKLFEISNGNKTFSGPILLGTERVALNAYYGLEQGGEPDDKPAVVVHSGLVHNFRVPTVEHSRRYSRDQSRSRITGGRNGKTQYLGAQKTLVDLYDELIESVAGYTVDGQPLTSDKDAIKLSMDTLHKQQAAYLLFNPQDEE